MGRKTWDSLPAKYRPLPNRLNVILTRGTAAAINANDENGMVEVCSDLEQALLSLSSNSRVNEIYVIGGGTVYE
jgi:dihydrofolate reductase